MADLIKALAKVAKTNNAQFWDMARRFSPDFKSHTSEKTLAEFNEKGFEQIKLSGTNVLNEFFEISMRIAFQMVNVARARNPLVDKGIIQVYDTPNGGYVQRMAVNSLKPVSPAFVNLEDGGSVDPFVVRKPEISERFFAQNFQYQSLVSVQEYQMKTMFISEYGMGELLAGIMSALANGYTVQEYLNAKECFNAMINSETTPLRDSQVLTLDAWTQDAPTADELTAFILALKDTATRMTTTPITGAYNAMGFESAPSPDDMVLVLRAGIRNKMNVALMVGAFNPEYLTLPFEVVEIDDFGGLLHTVTEQNTKVYPVYDKLGVQIGWSTTEGATTATYKDGEVNKIDPNARVLGLLVQRGVIFENAQNPYTVTPIYNPRGIYTNYWANRPNNGINYDALYNVIAFVAPVSVDASADMPADADLLGKHPADLQEGVVVDGVEIKGTLKYVTGYTGFSGDASLQEGNFLALHIASNDPNATITAELVGGVSGPRELDASGLCVFRVTDKTTQTIEVVCTLGDTTVTKTYTLDKLTLEVS